MIKFDNHCDDLTCYELEDDGLWTRQEFLSTESLSSDTGAGQPSNFHKNLQSLRSRINMLAKLDYDWQGVERPCEATIRHALAWAFEVLYDANCSLLEDWPRWVDPHITVNEYGEIVFEWKSKAKGLYFYISEDSVQYIKDPGTLVLSEMEDGEVDTYEKTQELWLWFMK